MQALTFVSNSMKSILVAPMRTVQIALQLSPVSVSLSRLAPPDSAILSKREGLVIKYNMNGSIKPFCPTNYSSYKAAFAGLGA